MFSFLLLLLFRVCPCAFTSCNRAFREDEIRDETLMHQAAATEVLAESQEETAQQVNGTAAGEVAQAAARLGVPVIQISTDYVFDGTLNRPYREDDPVGPISAYGRSKLHGERAVVAATSNHAILRTAWVYSAFGKNFVKTMLRLMKEKKHLITLYFTVLLD